MKVLVVLLCPFQLFATLWTVAHKAPLSMEFSRQEYWNGLPFPTPEDLPDPGIIASSLVSPVSADRFFTTVPPGKPSASETSKIRVLLKDIDMVEGRAALNLGVGLQITGF